MNKKHKLVIWIILFFISVVSIKVRADLQDSIPESWLGKSVDMLNRQAHEYMRTNHSDSAMTLFLVIGNRYDDDMKETDRRTSIHGLNNAGALWADHTGDIVSGYRYVRRAYDLAKRNGFDDMLPEIELHLANFCSLFDEQSEEVFESYKKCFRKAKELNSPNVMVMSFLNLLVNNYDGDSREFKDILSVDIAESTPKIDFARQLYRGLDLIQAKRYDDARRRFKEVYVSYYDRTDSIRAKALISKLIAKTFMSQNKMDSALVYFKEMLHSAEQVEMYPYQIEAIKMMRECYGIMGNERMRGIMHLRYLEVKDSLLEVNHIVALNALRHKDEVESVEREMNELAAKKKMQEVIGMSVAVILMMTLIFVGILWHNNKKLKSLNSFLYNKTQEMMHNDDNYLRGTGIAVEKYQNSSLQDTGKDEIERRVIDAMNNVEMISNPDFSLDRLAQVVGSNTAYVSRVINERMGVSFSVLLGNSRIKEVLLRMSDTGTYGHLTIEAISQGVGFRSRTPFVNSFKRVTGLTPSEYMREAKSRIHS